MPFEVMNCITKLINKHMIIFDEFFILCYLWATGGPHLQGLWNDYLFGSIIMSVLLTGYLYCLAHFFDFYFPSWYIIAIVLSIILYIYYSRKFHKEELKFPFKIFCKHYICGNIIFFSGILSAFFLLDHTYDDCIWFWEKEFWMD